MNTATLTDKRPQPASAPERTFPIAPPAPANRKPSRLARFVLIMSLAALCWIAIGWAIGVVL